MKTELHSQSWSAKPGLPPKAALRTVLCLLASVLCPLSSASAQTPVLFSTYNLTGQALNNPITVTALDPVFSDSESLYAGAPITLQPVGGVAATNLMPGDYRVVIEGIGRALTITVPVTNGVVNTAAIPKRGVEGQNTFFWTNALAGVTINLYPQPTISTATNAVGMSNGSGTNTLLISPTSTNASLYGTTTIGAATAYSPDAQTFTLGAGDNYVQFNGNHGVTFDASGLGAFSFYGAPVAFWSPVSFYGGVLTWTNLENQANFSVDANANVVFSGQAAGSGAGLTNFNGASLPIQAGANIILSTNGGQLSVAATGGGGGGGGAARSRASMSPLPDSTSGGAVTTSGTVALSTADGSAIETLTGATNAVKAATNGAASWATTTASHNATNVLGSAAYSATSAFDASGAAQAATNGLPATAFAPLGTFPTNAPGGINPLSIAGAVASASALVIPSMFLPAATGSVGVLYYKTNWSDLSDFSYSGFTPSVASGGYIVFPQGANTYDQTLSLVGLTTWMRIMTSRSSRRTVPP